MRINGSIFDPLRPERGTGVGHGGARQGEPGPQGPSAAPAPSDSIQFSDAGRSLAGRLDQSESLEPARVAELRTKVLTGAYHTLDVVDQVARRILTRGDL